MSWAEVGKINNNFNKPLNEQIRDNQFQGAYVFSEPTTGYREPVLKTFKPDKSGYYKVIVVGAGGNHKSGISSGTYYISTGGSGGVAIKTIHLSSSDEYSMEFTYDGNATFNGTVAATHGGDASGSTASMSPGDGGTAGGGDFNYPGVKGINNSGSRDNDQVLAKGASVGVNIVGLMKSFNALQTNIYQDNLYFAVAESGEGILGYGCSAGWTSDRYHAVAITQTGSAAIIIIPLELEE